MRLCLQCKFVRYSKQKGLCPNCGNRLVQVDGRLRKVVESLAKSDYQIAFANCETYTIPNMFSVQIVIGFIIPYDAFVFQDLPEYFIFTTDKHGYQHPYALSYVLNHTGSRMSMLSYECYGDPFRHTSAEHELKIAISELYKWAKTIEENKWFVYKLGGWL